MTVHVSHHKRGVLYDCFVLPLASLDRADENGNTKEGLIRFVPTRKLNTCAVARTFPVTAVVCYFGGFVFVKQRLFVDKRRL